MPHVGNVDPRYPHLNESALHAPTCPIEPMITEGAARMNPLKPVPEDVAELSDISVSVSSSITDAEVLQLKMSKKGEENSTRPVEVAIRLYGSIPSSTIASQLTLYQRMPLKH